VPGGVSWTLWLTASAGTSNLTLNALQFDYFDGSGTPELRDASSAADRREFYSMRPGSSRLLAPSDMCARLCVNVEPATSGSVTATFFATDYGNRPVTFSTPNVILR
jgi:hypothetical protein